MSTRASWKIIYTNMSVIPRVYKYFMSAYFHKQVHNFFFFVLQCKILSLFSNNDRKCLFYRVCLNKINTPFVKRKFTTCNFVLPDE